MRSSARIGRFAAPSRSALLLVAALAAGCRGPGMGRTGTILGAVRSRHGPAVPRAELCVTGVDSPGYQRILEADEAGRFRLGGLAPGRYRIARTTDSSSRVVNSEFAVSISSGLGGPPPRPPVRERGPAVPVRVRAGEEVRCDLVDPDRALVEGKIVGNGGEGVRIPAILREATWTEGLRPEEGCFYEPLVCRPEEDGSFEFPDLESGEYDVYVGDTRHRILVRRGERLEVRLQVASARISGTVVNADGRPVAGASVHPAPRHRAETILERMVRKSRRLSADRTTSTDGSFEIDVPPGGYVLEAPDGHGNRGTSREIAIADRQILRGFEIRIGRK